MSIVSVFLSYLLLAAICVAVGGVGAFLGIKMRKKKNAKAEIKE